MPRTRCDVESNPILRDTVDIFEVVRRLRDPASPAKQATCEIAAGEIHRLLKERTEINRALANRGQFLFAHIDGTFSVKDR